MQLVERESQLDRMAALLAAIDRGQGGCCVLVSGEAGIGKTSLVRRFADQHATRIETLCGGCEALFTPRPLGPLADLCDQLPPGLAASVHAGRTYNGLFPALLAFLRDRARTALFVIEDAHWADNATLDLVKYVGRRIASARAMLVLTYRDDLGLDHPLVRVLGELPAASTHRIGLPALSECAVEALAKEAGRSAIGLYQATGGNPFFLTEALASVPGQVPGSVRHAVLARIAQLSPAARGVVELASLSPARIERVLIKTLLGSVATALDECLDRGVLQIDRGQVAFRHELARQSVEQSLPPGRSAAMHAELFRALRARTPDDAPLARLVHHAERAGLVDDVRRLAPLAAAEAVDATAHREAAALYALALRDVGGMAPDARAALLDAAAREFRLVNDLDRAIAAQESARDLRRALSDVAGEGVAMRQLAVLHYERGDGRAAFVEESRAAIEMLERVPTSNSLIDAYATYSHALAIASRYAEAIVWGERAVRLAESSGDARALAVALFRLGSARLGASDEPDARAMLERAKALALEQRREDLVGSIHVSLQTFALIYHDHAAALAYAERGLAYCEAHDLDRLAWGLEERRAVSLFELGRWDEAERTLTHCLTFNRLTPMARDTALFLSRRLAARRGRPDDEKFWDIPRLLQGPLHIEYRPPYVAAACAEVAWLRGDHESVRVAAEAGLRSAFTGGEVRLIGPLLVWLHRVDAPLPEHPRLLPQHEREIEGDWTDAAAQWARHGCIYEEAMVLMGGDELALRRAIEIFDALGATPAAQIARRRLRAAGVRGVQRGPHTRTRSDPQGLTRREREVLELLGEGLSNQDVARRLHRSIRTVEHHVGALFVKLGVSSRAEAAALARSSGSSPKN